MGANMYGIFHLGNRIIEKDLKKRIGSERTVDCDICTLDAQGSRKIVQNYGFCAEERCGAG